MLTLLTGLLGALLVGSLVDIPGLTSDDDEGEDTQDSTDEVAADGQPSPLDHAATTNATTVNPIGGSEGADTIEGSTGDDLIEAGGGIDQAHGFEGEDTLLGGEDGDLLWGGDGDDAVLGEAGDDRLSGDDGDDLLAGGEGDDTLLGGVDADTMIGGAGDDALEGGTGDDVLLGNDGDDAISGGWGDDTLDGGAGADVLFGGAGDDNIFGGDEAADAILRDYLNGGDGADVLSLGADDWATGGEGEDTFVFEANPEGPAPMIEDFNAEEDALQLNYDASAGAPPDIAINPDPMDPDNGIVFADGLAVAVIKGGADLTHDMVRLVPFAETAEAA